MRFTYRTAHPADKSKHEAESNAANRGSRRAHHRAGRGRDLPASDCRLPTFRLTTFATRCQLCSSPVADRYLPRRYPRRNAA